MAVVGRSCSEHRKDIGPRIEPHAVTCVLTVFGDDGQEIVELGDDEQPKKSLGGTLAAFRKNYERVRCRLVDESALGKVPDAVKSVVDKVVISDYRTFDEGSNSTRARIPPLL